MISTAQYRAAAAEGATHLGLLLATYDVLAEDIRLAGLAAVAGNIAERCRLSGHATLLLGHLESWIPLLEDAVLETSLIRFYAFVRGELLRLQADTDDDGFRALSMQVAETRAAWQQKGESAGRSHGRSLAAGELILPERPVESGTESRFSWSA